MTQYRTKMPVIGKDIGTPPPQFNWTVRNKQRALVVLDESGEPTEVFELSNAGVLREAANWLESANGIDPNRRARKAASDRRFERDEAIIYGANLVFQAMQAHQVGTPADWETVADEAGFVIHAASDGYRIGGIAK